MLLPNRFVAVGPDEDAVYLASGATVTVTSAGPVTRISYVLADGQRHDESIEDTRLPYGFGVTRLDAQAPDPQFLIREYSGGAHCCTVLRALSIQDGKLVEAELGSFDAMSMDGLDDRMNLRDQDGDGIIDLIVNDDAFNYRFGSYADSRFVPRVVTLERGLPTDASRRPAFRPVFVRARDAVTSDCLREGQPAACAAYVAASARLGDVAESWQKMLRAVKPVDGFSYPDGCRSIRADGDCAAVDLVRDAGFAEGLRLFLSEHGYLSNADRDAIKRMTQIPARRPATTTE